jgi:hypothetical protein
MKTEFNDRSGKPIHTGDIIQWRLGKYAMKSRGPNLYRVIKTKKGIKLTPADAPQDNGWAPRKNQEEFMTIVDTKYRENE